MNRHTFVTLLALLYVIAGQAQEQIYGNPYVNHWMKDASGRLVSEQAEYRSEGSPYYSDNYSTVEITTASGKVYPNIQVKFNVQANEIVYRTPEGKEMVAAVPIRRIRFIAMAGEEGTSDRVLETFTAQAINEANAPVYEQADSGRITTLKQIRITYKDVKEFNEASPLRKFTRKESWWVRGIGNEVVKLETGKEALLVLLKDKSAEVTAYIEKERLKCRSIDDCRKVIRYYNTLF